MKKDNPQEELTEIDYAYAAGAIDSDGCIGSNKHSNCRSYRPYVVVVQKDVRLVEWFYKRFKGTVDLISRHREHKTDYYFRWTSTSEKAVCVLEKVLPYLVMKRQQAKLAISMVRDIKRLGRKFSNEEISFQKEVYVRIRSLNSPAETECFGSFDEKEMRQSELRQMINSQSIIRNDMPPISIESRQYSLF